MSLLSEPGGGPGQSGSHRDLAEQAHAWDRREVSDEQEPTGSLESQPRIRRKYVFRKTEVKHEVNWAKFSANPLLHLLLLLLEYNKVFNQPSTWFLQTWLLYYLVSRQSLHLQYPLLPIYNALFTQNSQKGSCCISPKFFPAKFLK